MKQALADLWHQFWDSFVGFMLAMFGGILVTILVTGWLLTSLFGSINFAPTSPKCPEDAVILGGGDFEGGYWDYLYCGPSRDDVGL